MDNGFHMFTSGFSSNFLGDKIFRKLNCPKFRGNPVFYLNDTTLGTRLSRCKKKIV